MKNAILYLRDNPGRSMIFAAMILAFVIGLYGAFAANGTESFILAGLVLGWIWIMP